MGCGDDGVGMSDPICPKCNKLMVLKLSRLGAVDPGDKPKARTASDYECPTCVDLADAEGDRAAAGDALNTEKAAGLKGDQLATGSFGKELGTKGRKA